MTLINQAVRAEPIFLSNNFLNRDAVIAVTLGDSIKERAFDMTRSSKWVSIGSVASQEETYDARLFLGSGQFIRSVDFIALLGINLRRFIVEYSSDDGVNWFTFDPPNGDKTGADFTEEDLILSIASPVDVNRIRIRATETQAGTGTDKAIGDIVVAKVTLQPARGLGTYEKNPEDNIKTVIMADKSIDYAALQRSDDSFEFYRATISFLGVTQAQRDLIRAIKTDIGPFLFVPEPGDIPGDMFICRIAPSSYRERYMDKSKIHYMINFDIEEIGGG